MNDSKPFDENLAKISSFNMGCTIRDNLEFKKFENHDNIMKICKDIDVLLRKDMTEEDKNNHRAYSLATWEDFPGWHPGVKTVVFQNLSRKFFFLRCLRGFGIDGGIKSDFLERVKYLREQYK